MVIQNQKIIGSHNDTMKLSNILNIFVALGLTYSIVTTTKTDRWDIFLIDCLILSIIVARGGIK